MCTIGTNHIFRSDYLTALERNIRELSILRIALHSDHLYRSMNRHAETSQLRSEDVFRQVLRNDSNVWVTRVLFEICDIRTSKDT